MSLLVYQGLAVVTVLICCGHPSNSNSLSNLVRVPKPPTKVNLDVNISIAAGRSKANQDDCWEEKPCPTHRIIGGCQVQANSMPWQVGITWTNRTLQESVGFFCGATIICPKYIISAAHCFFKLVFEDPGDDHPVGVKTNPEDLLAWVGAHANPLENDKQTRVNKHKIKAIHFHHQHNFTWDYDISVVELEKAISFKPNFAMAVYLPTIADRKLPDKAKFVVSGWGDITGFEMFCFAKLLNAVVVYRVSDEYCKSTYGKEGPNYDDPIQITERMICAGNEAEGKKDACQRDSGGPLTLRDPKTDEIKLIGAVSFGRECALPEYPGVYVDIPELLPWVKSIIGGCNEKTCNAGNCMKGSKLLPSVLNNFYN